MGAVGFLLEDAAFTHLRPGSHVRLVQEDGLRKKSAFQFNVGPQLAVINGDRTFIANPATC